MTWKKKDEPVLSTSSAPTTPEPTIVDQLKAELKEEIRLRMKHEARANWLHSNIAWLELHPEGERILRDIEQHLAAQNKPA